MAIVGHLINGQIVTDGDRNQDPLHQKMGETKMRENLTPLIVLVVIVLFFVAVRTFLKG